MLFKITHRQAEALAADIRKLKNKRKKGSHFYLDTLLNALAAAGLIAIKHQRMRGNRYPKQAAIAPRAQVELFDKPPYVSPHNTTPQKARISTHDGSIVDFPVTAITRGLIIAAVAKQEKPTPIKAKKRPGRKAIPDAEKRVQMRLGVKPETLERIEATIGKKELAKMLDTAFTGGVASVVITPTSVRPCTTIPS